MAYVEGGRYVEEDERKMRVQLFHDLDRVSPAWAELDDNALAIECDPLRRKKVAEVVTDAVPGVGLTSVLKDVFWGACNGGIYRGEWGSFQQNRFPISSCESRF